MPIKHMDGKEKKIFIYLGLHLQTKYTFLPSKEHRKERTGL